MNNIRIVSRGTAYGTSFYAIDPATGEQTELQGVSKMEFLPLEAGGIPQVRLTFVAPEIDVIAEAVD